MLKIFLYLNIKMQSSSYHAHVRMCMNKDKILLRVYITEFLSDKFRYTDTKIPILTQYKFI